MLALSGKQYNPLTERFGVLGPGGYGLFLSIWKEAAALLSEMFAGNECVISTKVPGRNRKAKNLSALFQVKPLLPFLVVEMSRGKSLVS